MEFATKIASRTTGFPEPFLERLCPLPQWTRTIEEYFRFHHRDVAILTDAELGRELRRVQLRADDETDPASATWLAERLDVLQREQRRRTRGTVFKVVRQ